uniref:hydroxymethylglutaryl-CoA lyase n=1 Tax=Acrobeloides nanus TaxID=290746 RepID=A0A914CQQ2_9BILA
MINSRVGIVHLSRSLSIKHSKESFRIVEVGPRDGLQNEKNFVPTANKVELINRLSNCGFKAIEATAYVSPKWIPQMADHEQVMAQIQRYPSTSYAVFVPNVAGLHNAMKSGKVDEIAVFCAASETFTKKNVNCTIEESLKRLKEVTELAQKNRLRIRGYISTVIGCPYDGKTDPKLVAKLAENLMNLGCYEISLGDTIGVGSVGSVNSLLDEVSKSVPLEKIAVHFHDTYGQALSNVLAAINKGIRTADSSVAGLGGCPYAKGATGNLASEDLVYMLNDVGFDTGIDLEQLVETGNWICTIMDRKNVSRSANALLSLKGVKCNTN